MSDDVEEELSPEDRKRFDFNNNLIDKIADAVSATGARPTVLVVVYENGGRFEVAATSAENIDKAYLREVLALLNAGESDVVAQLADSPSESVREIAVLVQQSASFISKAKSELEPEEAAGFGTFIVEFIRHVALRRQAAGLPQGVFEGLATAFAVFAAGGVEAVEAVGEQAKRMMEIADAERKK